MRKVLLAGLAVSAAFVVAAALMHHEQPADIRSHPVWDDPPIMREICSKDGEVGILYVVHGRATIAPTGDHCQYVSAQTGR